MESQTYPAKSNCNDTKLWGTGGAITGSMAGSTAGSDELTEEGTDRTTKY